MEKLRVLIADPSEGFRSRLKRFFTHHRGWEVVGEARDGLEAVTLAEALRPDLVSLDITLGTIGGLEVARNIKKWSPRTKVIFVTGHREKTYEVIADLLCVEGFVRKRSLQGILPRVLAQIKNSGPVTIESALEEQANHRTERHRHDDSGKRRAHHSHKVFEGAE